MYDIDAMLGVRRRWPGGRGSCRRSPWRNLAEGYRVGRSIVPWFDSAPGDLVQGLIPADLLPVCRAAGSVRLRWVLQPIRAVQILESGRPLIHRAPVDRVIGITLDSDRPAILQMDEHAATGAAPELARRF